VVTGAFQITFRAKIHVNDVFLFFKNYFWYQHIKTIQNIQIILNFSKKKIQIFWERSRSRVPKRYLTHAEGTLKRYQHLTSCLCRQHARLTSEKAIASCRISIACSVSNKN